MQHLEVSGAVRHIYIYMSLGGWRLKSGSLNLLETSGSVQTCNGIALLIVTKCISLFLNLEYSCSHEVHSSLSYPIPSPPALCRFYFQFWGSHICPTRLPEQVSIHKCENTLTHLTLMENLFFLLWKLSLPGMLLLVGWKLRVLTGVQLHSRDSFASGVSFPSPSIVTFSVTTLHSCVHSPLMGLHRTLFERRTNMHTYIYIYRVTENSLCTWRLQYKKHAKIQKNRRIHSEYGPCCTENGLRERSSVCQ